MDWLPMAQALENGEAFTEAKSEAAALAQENGALKEENAALKKQIEALESENKDFEALLDKANAEICRIQQEEAKKREKVKLWPEDAVKILVYLSEKQIATEPIELERAFSNLKPALVQYYLNELKDAWLVTPLLNVYDGVLWKIAPKGLAFLVETGRL